MTDAWRAMVSRVTGVVVGAALLFAQSAMGQEVDDATRASARQLGYSGVESFEAQDYPAASDKLERAYRVLQVPTLGLWSARALVKLGKLVQAQERYLKVARLQTGGGDAEVQRKAQADAAKELAALSPRIPSVVIDLRGAKPADVTLSIDGMAVASDLVGEPRPVDPGTHTLAGVRGSEKQEAAFTVTEAAQQHVALTFPELPAGAATPAPAASAASDAPAAALSAPPTDSPKTGSTQRTLGWVAITVGSAGLIIGGVTGGVAISKKGALDDAPGCTGNACPTNQQSKVDSYNSMRTLSSVGFIAGGVMAAAGIVLVLTAPSPQPSPSAALWLSPNQAGIRGSF